MFFYVNEMIDSKESGAPNISFTADDVQNKLIVSKISLSNIKWSDIIVGGNASNIEKWEPENEYVKVGQSINITVGDNPGDWCIVTILYKDRTIYGTYIFNK